jgi:methylmalonyl-CoA mutase cobalamin-binding subunit
MTITEAVEHACEEPTLVKALVWIAVWDTERAVRQAIEWSRTGISTASHDGGWDTCFEVLFDAVVAKYGSKYIAFSGVLSPEDIEQLKKAWQSQSYGGGLLLPLTLEEASAPTLGAKV